MSIKELSFRVRVNGIPDGEESDLVDALTEDIDNRLEQENFTLDESGRLNKDMTWAPVRTEWTERAFMVEFNVSIAELQKSKLLPGTQLRISNGSNRDDYCMAKFVGFEMNMSASTFYVEDSAVIRVLPETPAEVKKMEAARKWESAIIAVWKEEETTRATPKV